MLCSGMATFQAFNTVEFTEKVGTDDTVDIQRYSVQVGNQKFILKMKYVLRALVKNLDASTARVQ